jgi:hypothetical protein
MTVRTLLDIRLPALSAAIGRAFMPITVQNWSIQLYKIASNRK